MERKPAYLSSDDAMINYLIFTATAEEGYVERVDLGSIKDDKLNQFVFGRNFRLREGASIMKALNKEAARMKKEKMSSTEIESIMDSTKRVILKEQSGITVEKALEEEVKILMDRGMDEAEVKGIEDRIRSIIINRIEPAREEGRKKQDKKFYQSFLKEKKKKLVKSAKKKDEYNATTITIIDTIIAELNRGKSISGALEETRKKMMPSEGVVIDIGMGISMADEILGSIRLELLLAYREEERRRYNMSLAGALERERMRAQLKGITGEDDINESINKEIHINDIYDDPDIRNAVFADPDNSKYRTPDGKDNRTKYHDAMRLGMGEKAQWCDHFVHWCFLKAFDPNEFEGWRDKTDKSRNRIRQDILHYAMFETKNGSINETMQGRVHKNIELAGEHAFLSDQFDITRLDSKFKATWSKAVMKETEGKSDYEIVAYKLKNINKATFSSSENRSYWKEYATDYLNLNKSYGRMQESFAQVNLNEVDQKYEVLKSKPQPLKGDVFYLVGHIGIVTGVNETSISTIEGNTDSKGSHSGDGVYRKTRPLSEVMGFGRPDYSGLRTYLSDYYDEQEREKSQDSSQSASQEALSETEVDVNE